MKKNFYRPIKFAGKADVRRRPTSEAPARPRDQYGARARSTVVRS